MALTDWVRHALPLKLKDGKRHLFPTLASMVFVDEDKTPLFDANGHLSADNVVTEDGVSIAQKLKDLEGGAGAPDATGVGF